MNIKPKFNTNTIKMAPPPLAIKLKSHAVADPRQEIPNGIYKVIRWESLMIFVNIIVAAILLSGMAVLMIVMATVLHSSWGAYLVPSALALASSYKLGMSGLELNRIRREIAKYREDLKIGLTSQPPFLTRIYRAIIIKQIKQNWLTFFLIFNGTILTLVFWWLQNVSWWIFDFKTWIQDMFANPQLMTIIFALGLLVIVALHILLTIQRKRKLIEMDAYFGYSGLNHRDVDGLHKRYNQFFRRLFVIYIMVVLIIPLLARVILRVIRKK